jgi:Flp pilus assembly pilin Flp
MRLPAFSDNQFRVISMRAAARMLSGVMRSIRLNRRFLVRFRRADSGQDLVEYALLAAFVGVVGWAMLFSIHDRVGDAYQAWLDPTVGVPSLWAPAEPLGSGS